MNWRKIDENWKKFTENYQLESSRDKNNYFYGYQDIYIVKEKLNDFEIYYENKFNKPAEFGSSVGHAMILCSLIRTNKDLNLEVKRNAFRKKLIGKDDKLKIKTNNPKVKELLPIRDIELLVSSFLHLKISIKMVN